MLDDVSLRWKAASCSRLIGPNGAGKTSVLNCISGIYRGEGAHPVPRQDITGMRRMRSRVSASRARSSTASCFRR